jgi:hypothetical protein
MSSMLHQANPLGLILIAATLFFGCSVGYHLKKAEKHLKKAELLGASVRVDTIYKSISVIVPETRIDTVLTVQNFRDTLVFEKDRIVTRIKFDTLTKRVFVQTICPADTVRIEVPVVVSREIKSGWPWWYLIVAVLAGGGIVAIIGRQR